MNAEAPPPGNQSAQAKNLVAAGTAGWDDEVDLLVVGAGAAGMTAALVAAIEGCRALVCEKSQHVGGTTARSSGGIWIPGNHLTAAAGSPDSIEDARAYLTELVGSDDGDGLREAYLESSATAIHYLEQNSDVHFSPMAANPDYRELAGAATGGRPVAAVPFDGRKLGRDFALLAPPLPLLMALGGMMVARADIPHLLHPLRSYRSFSHSVRLVGRYLVDRLSHGRGTRLLMGNALAARLFYSLRKRNAPIWLNSTVSELIRDGDSVVGALVKTAGQIRRVRARCGVVLATGGFGHSPEWRRRLMNQQEQTAHSLAYEANSGDGLSMAEQVGARIERARLTSAAVWAPISKFRRNDGTVLTFPHFFMDRPKPGFIAVNHKGKRFVNEAASYHDFVAGMLNDPEVGAESPAYLICDRATLSTYGMGIVLPGPRQLRKYLRSGYLVESDSLQSLALKMNIDPVGLISTVDRNNQFAESGLDLDHGKGQSAFNRFHGNPEHLPNPCVGAISAAPFYAMKIFPADLATHAGIRANQNCQVLNTEGKVVAGLYVCGNDLYSIWEGEAPGPGVTLGPAVVFGYRSALHAIRYGGDKPGAAISPDRHTSP